MNLSQKCDQGVHTEPPEQRDDACVAETLKQEGNPASC